MPQAPHVEPAAGARPAPVRDRLAPLLLAGAMLVGTILRLAFLDLEARSPDEQIYARQARVVALHGFTGMRAVFDTFRTHPELHPYPPPTRVGYLWLVAAAMRVSGNFDARAGAGLACLASVLTLGLAIGMARRFLGAWPAVIGVWLVTAYPPELVIARRCWPDALVELAALGIAWVTLELLADPGRRRGPILLATLGSVAFLIKETTALFTAVCVVAALVALLRRAEGRGGAVRLIGAVLVGAIAATALLAAAAHGIAEPFQIMAEQARQNATNVYALHYATSPWYRFLHAWVKLSPVTTVLGVIGLLAALARGPREPAASATTTPGLALFAGLTLGSVALCALIPHWQNLRYGTASFAPLGMFAGAGAVLLFRRATAPLPARLAPLWAIVGLAALGLAVAADVGRFENGFVKGPGSDLSVRMVLEVVR